MVRTRTASRSRRAPARARAVPAGRPRIRQQSVVSQSSVGRSVCAFSPPRRVAGPSGTGFGRARARGLDGARSGADRAGPARRGTGRCERARARAFRHTRFARLDAGSSSLVGGAVGWLGGWFGWTSRSAGSGRRSETGARAREREKRYLRAINSHSPAAAVARRALARARAHGPFSRVAVFPFSALRTRRRPGPPSQNPIKSN